MKQYAGEGSEEIDRNYIKEADHKIISLSLGETYSTIT